LNAGCLRESFHQHGPWCSEYYDNNEIDGHGTAEDPLREALEEKQGYSGPVRQQVHEPVCIRLGALARVCSSPGTLVADSARQELCAMEGQCEKTLKERLDGDSQESTALIANVACVSEEGLPEPLPVNGNFAVAGAEIFLYISPLGTAIPDSNTDIS